MVMHSASSHHSPNLQHHVSENFPFVQKNCYLLQLLSQPLLTELIPHQYFSASFSILQIKEFQSQTCNRHGPDHYQWSGPDNTGYQNQILCAHYRPNIGAFHTFPPNVKYFITLHHQGKLARKLPITAISQQLK